MLIPSPNYNRLSLLTNKLTLKPLQSYEII